MMHTRDSPPRDNGEGEGKKKTRKEETRREGQKQGNGASEEERNGEQYDRYVLWNAHPHGFLCLAFIKI